ncbi:MAG: cell division topological specificity factor MinE, partial [Anaerolineae bacterium]|nr:cell division topological specificity factor MinE [Anaerolineae bacterium]
MTSFFDRFKGRKEPTSAELAKQRLQLVLVTDRSNLSQEKLEEMQSEIIKVIKRYVTIDDMEVQINFEQRDRKYHLVADIPLHRD